MVLAGSIAGTAYWFIMGALMTGEWPHLSRRVQRSLPQSKLGRIFLTWLNPGPAAGYMFAISNLAVLSAFGLAALWLITGGTRARLDLTAYYFCIFGWCYVAIFLGIGRLIINGARRFSFFGRTS